MTKDLTSAEYPHRFFSMLATVKHNQLATLTPIDLSRLADPTTAIRTALGNPNDFPAMLEAIVPGDRVAIAVSSDLPNVIACIEGVLALLRESQCDQICILLEEHAFPEVVTSLQSNSSESISVVIHDPDDTDSLAYLAAGQSADAIYLNRELTEADFVLPITTAQPRGCFDLQSHGGGIFPKFADRSSQWRVHQSTADQVKYQAQEAAWLLGLQLFVEVLPTADGRAAQVVAGSPTGIHRSLASHVESSWQRADTKLSDSVIASIDGPPAQQNWRNVARGLYVASKLAAPGGTIAVCCGLNQSIGPALSQLSSDDTYEETAACLRDTPAWDLEIATLLLRLREEYRVLLASELPNQTIEDMGLGVIDQPASLQRLIDQSESVVVVRAAQFCGVGSVQQEIDS